MKRTPTLMLLTALLSAGMATAVAAGPRSGGQGAYGGRGPCVQAQAAGGQVLTAQERLEMREQMRNAASLAERNALRAEHRQLIQERLRTPTPQQ